MFYCDGRTDERLPKVSFNFRFLDARSLLISTFSKTLYRLLIFTPLWTRESRNVSERRKTIKGRMMPTMPVVSEPPDLLVVLLVCAVSLELLSVWRAPSTANFNASQPDTEPLRVTSRRKWQVLPIARCFILCIMKMRNATRLANQAN